jgi:hypothetical protein
MARRQKRGGEKSKELLRQRQQCLRRFFYKKDREG